MNTHAQPEPIRPISPTLAEDYQTLLASFAQAFWETDAAGRGVTDSPSWRAYTGQTLDEWLGAGWPAAMHPDDRQHALHQWQQAVGQQTPVDAEFRLQRPDGSWRWTNLRASPILNSDGSVNKWLGLNLDISAQKEAEAALRLTQPDTPDQAGEEKTGELAANQQLLKATLDSSLDMIQVFRAVRDEQGAIVDFVWVVNNHTSEKRYGDVIGKRLLALNPGVVEEGIFETFKNVVETGIPDQSERHYVHEQFNGWFHQSTVKLNDGVATTTTDITSRKRDQQQVQETKALQDAVFNTVRHAIIVFEAIRDEAHRIVDFRYLLSNGVADRHMGIATAGQTLRTVTPGYVDEANFRTMVETVETGGPADKILHFNYGDRPIYLRTQYLKLNDGLVLVHEDITDKKLAEDELKTTKERLQAILDSSPYVIQAFQAVRGQTGTITDFTWVMNNGKGIEQNGEVIGKSLLQHNPGVLGTGLFQKFVEVTETGVSIDHEQYYIHEQFDGWFHQSLVKMGDGFVMNTENITEKKRAEQEILRLKDEIAQRATDKYYSLFNSIDEGFCILELLYDSEGKLADLVFREVNPSFDRHTRLGDVVGKTVRQLMPNFEPYWIDLFTQVAQSGQPTRYENYVQDVDRWYTTHHLAIGGHVGRFVAVVFDDITQRKKAEEALRLSEQRKAYLLKLADGIRPLYDPRAIQQEAIGVLRQHLKANRITYTEAVQDNVLEVCATDQATGEVNPLGSQFALADYGPDLTAEYLTGQTLYRNNVASDAHLPEAVKAIYAALNVKAWASTPLVKAGRLVALMTVHFAQEHNWTAEELLLVEETAERTWAATERAKTEQALEKAEVQFRTIANAAPALVWICAPSGENIFFNERWYEYTGQTTDTAASYGWTTATHAEDWERIAPYWERCLKTGEPYEGEVRYRRFDGEWRWFAFRSLPTYTASGAIEAWYGLSIDIHERKRAEEQLHEADRRKDEFLAMLAHELRNPMSTIRSGLQVLTLKAGEDKLVNLTVTMMNRQTDHLVRLVDDLLDVSRISQGKIELRKQRENLVDLVSQAAEAINLLYREQGRHLQVDLPAEPIHLEGDATRLMQVVANLLTNGLRYTLPGGQVWLSLEHQDGPALQPEAIIRVSDNGIGLAPHQLSVIFDLFVQVDNSLARSKGGLGLGLTLVKRLVEMHGGRVEAQSEGLGKGSTFSVYLPTARETLPPASGMDEKRATQSSGNRILVVDDNTDVASTLSLLLTLRGYEVHTRHSGRAAIDAIEALQPTTILMDIGMPELDGYATCRLIRQRPQGRQLIVIALTGYGQEEDRQRTWEAGFDAHLVKPVDLGTLTTLLDSLFENKVQRQ